MNYGNFLIMGNAGFISSTVLPSAQMVVTGVLVRKTIKAGSKELVILLEVSLSSLWFLRSS